MAFVPRDERRARLAEATWRVITERGISAVSVRTVAGEAGMAVGSLRHLFSTQRELLEFSAELMVERATRRVEAITPSDDVVAYAMAVIRELIPLAPDSRREFEINIALIAETPANPGLAEIRNRTHELLVDLFGRIVVMLHGGQAPTDDDQPDIAHQRESQRLLALVDGLGLHLLHQSPDADASWATDIIRTELVRIHHASR